MAQLRMEYVRALERGPVIVVGDFNYDLRGASQRQRWTEK